MTDSKQIKIMNTNISKTGDTYSSIKKYLYVYGYRFMVIDNAIYGYRICN